MSDDETTANNESWPAVGAPFEPPVRRSGGSAWRGPAIDLTGRRFGRLTVLAVSHRNKHRDYFWRCQCDCGTVKVLKADDFKHKKTRSCGCLQLSLTRDERIDDEQLLLKTPNAEVTWRRHDDC